MTLCRLDFGKANDEAGVLAAAIISETAMVFSDDFRGYTEPKPHAFANLFG